MKRVRIAILIILSMLIFAVPAHAKEEIQNLEDIITESKESIYVKENSNQSFINGLVKASDLAVTDVQGAKKITEGIRLAATWIVQILSYGTIVLLGVRVLLDIVYIALPFTRGFLNNTGTGSGSMQLGAGAGIGAGAGMMQPGTMQPGMSTTNQSPRQYQLISNAAIRAVENENGQSTLKEYVKDMVITLIAIPVLITLTITGTLTNLGFLIGETLVDLIKVASSMIGI